MGTANFYRKNTGLIYSFIPEPYEDEETGEVIEPDYEFEYECFKDSIADRIKNLSYDMDCLGESISSLKVDSGLKLGRIKSTIRGFDTDIYVTAVMLYGYYEGVNLDWLLDVEFDHDFTTIRDEVPDKEDIIEILTGFYNNAGMAKIQAKNCINQIQKEVDRLTGQLETAYKDLTMPLRVVATASNGEQFLERVTN